MSKRKYYTVATYVTNVQGWQSWRVYGANSRREALDIFNKNGPEELDCEELEIRSSEIPKLGDVDGPFDE